MNTVAVFELIQKGLTLLPLLLDAGEEVGGIITRLKALSAAGAAGTVTDDDLATLEADIDAKLEEFNSDLEA